MIDWVAFVLQIARRRAFTREALPVECHRREGTGDIGCLQRSEPQGPRAVQLLAEGMLHSRPLQLGLVLPGSLEGRIEPIASIVDGPDRQSIGNWTRPARDELFRAHGR